MDWLRRHQDAVYGPSPPALLADRRISARELLPILDAALEAGAPAIHVQAIAVGSFRSAEGRAITWNVCSVGHIDHAMLHGLGPPHLATWGEVAADHVRRHGWDGEHREPLQPSARRSGRDGPSPAGSHSPGRHGRARPSVTPAFRSG